MLADVWLKSLSNTAESAATSQMHRRFSTVVVRLLRKLKVLSSILRAGISVYCILEHVVADRHDVNLQKHF